MVSFKYLAVIEKCWKLYLNKLHNEMNFGPRSELEEIHFHVEGRWHITTTISLLVICKGWFPNYIKLYK